MVPYQKELALGRIVQGKGEHSIEILGEIASIFLICVDNDLCVGVGDKDMTHGFQIASQFPKIIDFSIEHCSN